MKMTTYEAMLAAADHIEQWPKLYQFNKSVVPGAPHWRFGDDCACMLGRIGALMGFAADTPVCHIAEVALQIPESIFYQHIANLMGPGYESSRSFCQAAPVARALREYAQRYLQNAAIPASPPLPLSLFKADSQLGSLRCDCTECQQRRAATLLRIPFINFYSATASVMTCSS